MDWGNFDLDNGCFNDWYKAANAEGIGEYERDVVKHGLNTEYKIIHDSFDSLNRELDDLRKKYPQYQINSLTTIGSKFVRACRNEQKFLLNIETGNPLTGQPLDVWEESLNHIAYVVKQNGLSRLLHPDGWFLTEYVHGKFEWEWDRHKSDRTGWTAIIYNEEADIAFKIWLNDVNDTFEPVTMEYALYEPK